jgi:Xaa-Pro dipeptidase
MHAARFDRLNQAIQAAGLDAIALNPGPTLTYLTGLSFHLMERPTVLLAAPGQPPVLVVPELELTKARSAGVPLSLATFGDNPATWGQVFEQAAAQLGLDGKIIGVEPNRMRYLELRYLQNAMPRATFDSAEGVLSSLRMQKDAAEVDAMRQAVRIAQDALRATLPFIKPGVTERQIAAELMINLLRAGGEGDMPFQPIVSGGPHAADPHAVPTDRPVQMGDLLVIDWGASYHGYISDLTRTFAIGEPEPEFRRIAEIVRLSNEAGRAAARPGIPAGDVDHAARKVIDDSGYGAAFFHRTGHGIGMEGHEPPYMYGENPLILKPGMAFTVEPGIYLVGRNGVRIEDNLVITEDGAETLSDLPRELIVLPQ